MDKAGEETLKIMKIVRWYNNWLFSLIKPFLKGEMLEAGAGIGNFTHLLASCSSVVSIDINKDYIKGLREMNIANVKVGFGDIEKGEYFFEQEKFDTIVCLNVLEHIEGDNKTLRNLCKLLTANGRLILLVPAHQFAYGTLDKNLGHFRRYTKDKLMAKLKEAGFKIRDIRYLNLLGVLGWFMNARIFKRRVLSKNQLRIFDKVCRPALLLEKYIEPPLGLSILAIAEKR